jgi:uncharacterized protein GlcG (DUF336 family)
LSLDLKRTQGLLDHVISQAFTRFEKPVCVAVCDAHGFLIGFFRADGAPVRSIALAQQKAYTATRMGSSTTSFLKRLRDEDIPISYFCDPLLTALPGGELLTDGSGRVIGGIGVSGLLPMQDQEIANIGAELVRQP